MSKKEKLKLKVESQYNWHNISFDELKTYLLNHKFVMKEGKGSHVLFIHKTSLRPFVVAKHGNYVKAAYVKEAVKLVYEYEIENKWR